jgi:MFS family permease
MSVATDILGVTGRQILAALAGGHSTPEVLAELARGRLRQKKQELRQALRGRFREHHAFFIGRLLVDLDNLEESMTEVVQGAAGAAMIPSSQAIMMETFPPEEQQLAMATWGVGMMVVPILGPTLGGWITDNWNWRWNFDINLPVGTIAFMMVSIFVHHISQSCWRSGKGLVRS